MSPRIQPRPGRLPTEREKSVERTTDDLFTAAGFRTVRFSQARASQQTLGIPDRRYVSRALGLALWFEAKAADGDWSREQQAFAQDCDSTGELYVVGGTGEAYAVLAALDCWDGRMMRVSRGPVLQPGDPYRQALDAVARMSQRRWRCTQAARLETYAAYAAHVRALDALVGEDRTR